MISPLGFFVHAAWVLAVAGITGVTFYWLVSRFLSAAAAEAPDVIQRRLDDLPADREG